MLLLIEHSHLLALTQEIKFLSTEASSDLPLENQKKRDWEEKIKVWWVAEKTRMCHMQGENILAGVRHRMKASLCSWIQDGTLYSKPDLVVKIFVGCSKTFSRLHFSDAVCTYHLFRLRLKQLSFLWCELFVTIHIQGGDQYIIPPHTPQVYWTASTWTPLTPKLLI